ncbi:MFS general substrate transporter [Aspergillus taichungensis]|uniref:MFS general substrate transporter n=1 Tax=Aspergillus taichungensis TaxID=482145 RepID=A0A2J5I763_9EURO|nr:MFS general substrate transporter [Aspergillus taichungensis]
MALRGFTNASMPESETERQTIEMSNLEEIVFGEDSKQNEEIPDHDDFKLSVTGQLVFLTLSVLMLMVALDGTSISVALPKISLELHGLAMEAFWSGTSFLLCSTVFQPTTATLSNVFGRRPVLSVSLTLFFIGSLLAGIAKNFTDILIGRCIQGVGGGGIAVLSEIIVTDLVPLRLRGRYYGILSAMYSVGSVLGPILGGGFSEKASWRWIFYINFPFIGIAAFLVIFFFRLPTPKGSLRQKLACVDWTGAVLFIGSVSAVLIPLSWGGIMHAWASWRTVVPLSVGAAGLVVFCIWEAFLVSTEPMIPPDIFHNRSGTIALATSFLQGLNLWCALYYLPLYYEAVRGFGPILTGVALFPETFTIAPAAIFCGLIVTATGHYRWGLWVGWGISAMGAGLLCLLEVDTPTVAWIFLNTPGGIGIGILTAALVCAVQASATRHNLTASVAMVVFFRSFGQAVGIAVGGVVFQNRMRHHLQGYVELAPRADELARDAAALVTTMRGMTDEVAMAHLKQAYTDSLRAIWAVCCGISGVGLALSVFVKKYDLNRALQSDNDEEESDKQKERK